MTRLTPLEVFATVGKPTITYVERDSGEHERRLKASLLTPGQICLLTGPSKLGKTSLHQRVLPELKRQPLLIRCSGQLDARDFWAKALEQLDFSVIAERADSWGIETQTEIGVKGELGWKWLARLMPTASFRISGSTNEEIKKSFIHSKISASHLLPLLKRLPLQLIVEDFHYLKLEVQKEVFQQWKSFVDEGVSALVVSTTHHASDIANSNPDLTGRTRHIDIGQWKQGDLERIVQLGLDYFRIKNRPNMRSYIAEDSVGIPIITQQICQDFVISLDIERNLLAATRDYRQDQIEPSVKKVAAEFYSSFDRDYDRLVDGPRRSTRKHDTYSMILSAFALHPMKFSLSKSELISRVNSLCGDGKNIPLASINSSLSALSNHQRKIGANLLEWQKDKDMLHIVEPSFLFYLRQRLKEINGASRDYDFLLRHVLQNLKITISDKTSEEQIGLFDKQNS